MLNNKIDPVESTSTKVAVGSQTIFKYINILILMVLMFCIRGFLQFRTYCESKGYYAISADSFRWCGFGFFAVFVLILLKHRL